MIWNIIDLLHEFQDLFPAKFSEMKGIVDDPGEMKIPLKLDAKPVKHQPYRLNPRYKEKVKAELYRIINAWIIEPVEESEWISPIVIQDKKENKWSLDLRRHKEVEWCMHARSIPNTIHEWST